jgi:hypothetical protein
MQSRHRKNLHQAEISYAGFSTIVALTSAYVGFTDKLGLALTAGIISVAGQLWIDIRSSRSRRR